MLVKVVSVPHWIIKYQNQAQKLWCNHRPPHLFNDLIAIVLGANEREVTICWVPYCLRWAQEFKLLTLPSSIYTLSVGALVTSDNMLLAGLRSDRVAAYPAHWEFAPAGGVSKVDGESDDINLQVQILTEWQEELQIDVLPIRSLKSLKQPLVFKATRTWIALFRIETHFFEPLVGQEVCAWRWLTEHQIQEEIAKGAVPWVTGSDRLLKYLHRI